MSWSGKRVVLVGPVPPPAGGMAGQTQLLSELLQSEGVEVCMVPVNAPYHPRWAGKLRGVRAVFRLLPYFMHLWKAVRGANLVHVMANSGWSWHLFAAPAIWVASVCRVPVVVNYRGGEADAFLSRSARWVRPSLARAQALVVPSGFLQAVFARYGVDSCIVPNVLDLALFSPAASRSIANAPHIVVARNLEPIYGIPTALRAFAMILADYPAARLSIAGSGPQAAELEALARSLGVANSVRFTGRLDREQMSSLYRESDLMLNPTRVDNSPNSILEALASGLPVVSTSVGGVPFIVEDGRTALLVPPEDPGAMASAIRRLLASPELRQQLIGNGLADAHMYAWTEVRKRLFETYDFAAARIASAALPER